MMGRICAWCGTFLTLVSADRRNSHVLCSGCLEQLQTELATEGLALPRDEQNRAC